MGSIEGGYYQGKTLADISGRMHTTHLHHSVAIRPNLRVKNSAQTTFRFSPIRYLAPRLESKTLPKKLLGFLLLVIGTP